MLLNSFVLGGICIDRNKCTIVIFKIVCCVIFLVKYSKIYRFVNYLKRVTCVSIEDRVEHHLLGRLLDPRNEINLTVVKLYPLSVNSEEFDDQESVNCETRTHETIPLEQYPHNCDMTKVLNVKEEREFLSDPGEKIEIKKEDADCNLGCKVIENALIAKALEINSGSEIDSFAQEEKHLFDGLTTSEGNMLMANEHTGGTQSKEKATFEDTINSVYSKGCFSKGKEDLEMEFESICDVSIPDLKEEKPFQNDKYTDTFDDNGDSVSLNEGSETLRCGAEELPLSQYEHDVNHRFSMRNMRKLKLQESILFSEKISTPNRMRADIDHSDFKKLCASGRMSNKPIKEESGVDRSSVEDQETLNFLQGDEMEYDHHHADQDVSFMVHLEDTKCAGKYELRQPGQSHSSGWKHFSCNVCEASFSGSDDLKQHKLIHVGKKTHSCAVCNLSFTGKYYLKLHMLTHTGEKPFKCVICEASFSTNGTLKDHMRTHTGEKPFKCDICGAAFSHSPTLKRHGFTHTREKPFKCEICEASFSQKHNLNVHNRSHTGEKPLKCSFCEVSFTESGHLKTHIRTHTGEKPFKCGICQASFSVNSNLKNHIRIHTGEKPFRCYICEATFSQKTTLINHKRTHMGEKPFKCKMCDASYTQAGSLNSHMRTHAGFETIHV